MSRGEGSGKGVDATFLSDTLRYINLAEGAVGLVALRGPMHLCVCVYEERGGGEGVGSPAATEATSSVTGTEATEDKGTEDGGKRKKIFVLHLWWSAWVKVLIMRCLYSISFTSV